MQKFIRIFSIFSFSHFLVLSFAQNVGIGLLSPAGKLHIKGSADVSQLIIDGNNPQSNTKPIFKIRDWTGSDLMWIHSDNSSNTFMGFNTGKLNSFAGGGFANTFIGGDAGRSNTTGTFNLASGARTLYSNITGDLNTASGNDALFANTEGNDNTAYGAYSLYYNVAGSGATAIGAYAMRHSNNSSSAFTNNNVAVGYEALRGSGTPANNTGTSNTALGYQTLRGNTTGTGNTGTGYQTFYTNATGNYNTANGNDALFWNTTGSNNTAIGGSALRSNIAGSRGTAIGFNAMKYVNNTTTPFGNYNVAVGYEALLGSTSAENNTGNNNTAIGYLTLSSNTSGNDNTAIGSGALYTNTKGNQNIAQGRSALIGNTSASQNIAIGNFSLATQSFDPGSSWISGNIAIGYQAMLFNQPTSISNGINNTAIGNNALTTNITGANNTAIGYNADVSSNNLTNATAIGYNAKVAASNSLVLGGTGTDAVNVGIGTTNPNAKLEVVGTLKVVDGTQGAGKILTSNATGLASWQPPPPPPGTNDPSVSICCQRWMTKNLDVATYRNGDAIPKVTDNAAWAALTTGAYCYYNNDSTTYAATYGKLYNWYAVNDSRGLAPEGWYIPTDFEWTTLGNCLGGDAVAGGPMKEIGTTHWTTPNAGATNLSGFTGLPGGRRSASNGLFHQLGFNTYFWSSTEYDMINSFYRDLDYNYDDLFRTGAQKGHGVSVRCLRD